MQLLIASAHINRNVELSRALLKFVVSSTMSPKSIELNYRAQGLLNSLSREPLSPIYGSGRNVNG
jgi:hypothetical protein